MTRTQAVGACVAMALFAGLIALLVVMSYKPIPVGDYRTFNGSGGATVRALRVSETKWIVIDVEGKRVLYEGEGR